MGQKDPQAVDAFLELVRRAQAEDGELHGLRLADLTTCAIPGLVLSEDCHELRWVVVDLYQAADLGKE